jgi:small subunit ribosomal protein S16
LTFSRFPPPLDKLAQNHYTFPYDGGMPEPPDQFKLIRLPQIGNRTGGLFMSTRIRLKKFGTKKRPYYRIVVMEKQAPRDGKTIDEIGYYHPIEAESKQIVFDAEKAKAWLAKGATASDTVRRLFNKKNVSVK